MKQEVESRMKLIEDLRTKNLKLMQEKDSIGTTLDVSQQQLLTVQESLSKSSLAHDEVMFNFIRFQQILFNLFYILICLKTMSTLAAVTKDRMKLEEKVARLEDGLKTKTNELDECVCARMELEQSLKNAEDLLKAENLLNLQCQHQLEETSHQLIVYIK